MVTRNPRSLIGTDRLPSFRDLDIASTGSAILDTLFSGLVAAGYGYAETKNLDHSGGYRFNGPRR